MKIRTICCHRERSGALEITHRLLVGYLKCCILTDQSHWDEWTPCATFAVNPTEHMNTGITYLEVLFGRKPNIPSVLQKHQRFSILMTTMLRNSMLTYSQVMRL
jgi:hypothetical protein